MATYGNFTGIATDGTNVYVAAKKTAGGAQYLLSIDSSGSVIGEFNASSYSFNGICLVSASELYLCDLTASQVVKFNGSSFSSFATSLGAVPNDITTDNTYLYVALANATIKKIDISTASQTTLVSGGLSSASYISYGSELGGLPGYLNVSDTVAGKVYQVNKTSGALTQSVSGITNLRGVYSIDAFSNTFVCTSTALYVGDEPAPDLSGLSLSAGDATLSGYVDGTTPSIRFDGLTYVTSISAPSSGAPIGFLVDYNNAAIRKISYSGPPTVTTFYAGAGGGGGGGGAPCFLEGSEILCLVDDKEVYIPVEQLRKGTLVKTSLDGYKKVEAVGKKGMWNTQTPERIQQRLYKLTPANYPELKKDLFLTGCHSILVDELTDVQRQRSIEELERIFVTDKKYRLIACVDERAEPWQSEGAYLVWHFALECENIRTNYGVYANGGLLVETCSINFIRNRSNLCIV